MVAQRGAIFNISGGAVQYQGGYVQQTLLLGSDGRIYSADNAPSNLSLSSRWRTASSSITREWKIVRLEVYLSPFGKGRSRWENGYTDGPRCRQSAPLDPDLDLRRHHPRQRDRRRASRSPSVRPAPPTATS